ncbi:MAG: hypothetical protein ACRC62_29740 [Microcoleus sp.]
MTAYRLVIDSDIFQVGDERILVFYRGSIARIGCKSTQYKTEWRVMLQFDVPQMSQQVKKGDRIDRPYRAY